MGLDCCSALCPGSRSAVLASMWAERYSTVTVSDIQRKKKHCTHARVFKDARIARIHLLRLVNGPFPSTRRLSCIFVVCIYALDCCWGDVFLSGRCSFGREWRGEGWYDLRWVRFGDGVQVEDLKRLAASHSHFRLRRPSTFVVLTCFQGIPWRRGLPP